MQNIMDLINCSRMSACLRIPQSKKHQYNINIYYCYYNFILYFSVHLQFFVVFSSDFYSIFPENKTGGPPLCKISDIAGGYLCFIISILGIGVVTAIIGDVASYFGCTLGIKDSVTAIVFVALGTSIPGEYQTRCKFLIYIYVVGLKRYALLS